MLDTEFANIYTNKRANRQVLFLRCFGDKTFS